MNREPAPITDPAETPPPRPKVVKLDPAVISKIAAGEMILRPFSVAKELVENALDAGARNIEVALGDSPDALLVVSDDGIGMTQEDLLLALETHATSKLRTEDDLLRVGSLGFRGEAIPSIGRVSRMEILTAPDDSGSGVRVVVEGGAQRELEPTARSRGTTVRVEDLFYNSPVRKRFLKSPAGELRMISKLVTTYAFAHPEVGFRLTHRSVPVLELPGADSLSARVTQVHGASMAEKLLHFEAETPRVQIFGVVGIPELARPGTQHQTFLVNRRWVTAPWFAAALRQSFGDLLPPNRHPFAIALLQTDPSRIDVNVHPTKREIRFLDESQLFGELVRAVRAATVSLVPTWNLDPRNKGGGTLDPRDSRDGGQAEGAAAGTDAPGSRGGATSGGTPWEGWRLRPRLDGQTVLDRLYGAPSRTVSESPSTADGAVASETQETRDGDAHPASGTSPRGAGGESTGESTAESTGSSVREAEPPFDPAPIEDASSRPLVPVWQLHRRYLFAQTSQGLLVIDQHAAHERILYEVALQQLQSGRATTQQLLFPVVVHLDPEEWETFKDFGDELTHLGVDAEEFGEQAVLLRGTPALWNEDPQGFFRETLTDIRSRPGRGLEQRFQRVAASFACRSAIKSGKSLTLEEMNTLIDQLFATEVPHGDPHGRPTFVQISLLDLDRRFGRAK